MPTSTFWNQVRLITPGLEPLVPLFHGRTWAGALLWSPRWIGDWQLTAILPEARLLTQTPPLALMRQPLATQVKVWESAHCPDWLLIESAPLNTDVAGLPDLRIAAALIETLAGLGLRSFALTGDGNPLAAVLHDAAFVALSDHINWARDNILVGYPAEADTPSRFIDTQHLYAGWADLPSAIALYALPPAFQTPAEFALAQRLGAELITSDVVPEALLARFHRASVRACLRTPHATDPQSVVRLLAALPG